MSVVQRLSSLFLIIIFVFALPMEFFVLLVGAVEGEPVLVFVFGIIFYYNAGIVGSIYKNRKEIQKDLKGLGTKSKSR